MNVAHTNRVSCLICACVRACIRDRKRVCRNGFTECYNWFLLSSSLLLCRFNAGNTENGYPVHKCRRFGFLHQKRQTNKNTKRYTHSHRRTSSYDSYNDRNAVPKYNINVKDFNFFFVHIHSFIHFDCFAIRIQYFRWVFVVLNRNWSNFFVNRIQHGADSNGNNDFSVAFFPQKN